MKNNLLSIDGMGLQQLNNTEMNQIVGGDAAYNAGYVVGWFIGYTLGGIAGAIKVVSGNL